MTTATDFREPEVRCAAAGASAVAAAARRQLQLQIASSRSTPRPPWSRRGGPRLPRLVVPLRLRYSAPPSSCSAARLGRSSPFAHRPGDRRRRRPGSTTLSLGGDLDRLRPGTGGQVADVLQPRLDQHRAPVDRPRAGWMVRLAIRRRACWPRPDWARLEPGPLTARRSGARRWSPYCSSLSRVRPAAPRARPGSAVAVASGLRPERWPQRTYLTVVGPGGPQPAARPPRRAVHAGGPGRPGPSVEPQGPGWIVPGAGRASCCGAARASLEAPADAVRGPASGARAGAPATR